MSRIKVIAIIGFLSSSCSMYSQQHVESYMLEIPKQVIQYKIDGDERRVTVNDFYISRFPESIGQYQEFLDQLPSDLINEALPHRERLKSMNIRVDLIEFLINEYFVSKDYRSYPVVGLDYEQINRYLKWKTDTVGKRVLKEMGIEYNDEYSYLEVIRSLDNSISRPIQVEFHMPTESCVISAHNFRSRYNDEVQIKKSESTKLNYKYLKKLKLKPIHEFDLKDTDHYNRMDELIYHVDQRFDEAL